MPRRYRPLAAVILLTWFSPSIIHAQQNAADRRKFLSPVTVVSDDPRRTPVPPGPRGPAGSLVLRGGRIFDSTGLPARDGTLVITRNKIVRVLPPDSTDWPADARVIDVSGKTILPGLIDLHTHITYVDASSNIPAAISEADSTLRAVEKLRFYLESGITSIRDVGSKGDIPFRLKEWVAQNRIAGPRVFAAGQFITSTGGHSTEGLPRELLVMEGATRLASGPDDWRQAVRDQFTRGADVIKIGSHFSKAELAAAVEEAHALGLKVTADVETFYTQWAVEAGVDTIEHPLPRTDEVIQLMARKGIAADPTLIPYQIIFDQWGGYFGSTSRRFTFSKDANLEMLRRLKKAGIKMGIGTDLILEWFRSMPEPYINEMKNFVAAGFSVPEVLAIATKSNAEILDMSDKLGTLEPGKLADVLVVGGKPDADLDDLKNVDLVIRDGYLAIENGRVVVPRHASVPMAAPQKPVPSAGSLPF
jgi:imidazolonepropionase-like amidohydrolase